MVITRRGGPLASAAPHSLSRRHDGTYGRREAALRGMAHRTGAQVASPQPLAVEISSISDSNKRDMHFWLDIDNALACLDKIEETMAQADPKNKDKFANNKEKATKYLNQLKDKAGIIPTNKKFIALHDGFDYFFEYFNLNGKTLGVDPENISTPAQIATFRKQLAQIQPDCIIVEPSLTKRQKTILGLDSYHLQKTDAFGWNINNGPSHFYKMMMWNIQQLNKCTQK